MRMILQINRVFGGKKSVNGKYWAEKSGFIRN